MSAPLLRACCAGPQKFIQSEKKLGKKLCSASLIDVTSVSRGCAETECLSLGETLNDNRLQTEFFYIWKGDVRSDRGRIQSPVLDVRMGIPRSGVVTVRPGTCIIHKLWYPWAFSDCHALNWDSRPNIIIISRIVAMIVMDPHFDLLPHTRSSIFRVQVVVGILFCASQCPAFISWFGLSG